MPRAKTLTEKALENLKPGAAMYELPDPARRGFYVRVERGGTIGFYFRYQLAGRRQRMFLGHYRRGDGALAKARARFGEAEAKVQRGEDPQEATRRPKARGFTVRELAEEFRDRHLQPKVGTWREAWRILEKDVLGAWGNRDAATISPREVVLLLDGVMDRGAERVANRVRSLLVQMFRFGVSRGLVAASPVVAVEPPTRKAGTRDRILSDAEIRTFWRKIESAHMLPRVSHALRLLLITGQRRSEVALARWQEFDLEAATWTIPAERAKNRREHVVPLTPMALAALAALRVDLDAAAVVARMDQDGRYAGAWLFPSPHWTTDEPIDPKAVTRAVSRNREHWGVPAFTVHDLRRTVRSNLSALGVSPIVAKKVLNHTLEGMDAIYDRHDYAAEKRQALALWADHLAGTIRGKRAKVAPLRRAAR